MFKRHYLDILKKRMLEPRRFIQVITGPRQVGKTTMVHQLFESIKTAYLYESADGIIEHTELWISNQWNRARLLLKEQKEHEVILCLDEIQKIPHWNEYIKKEWDFDSRQKLPIKVILLGSSSLLIHEGLSESLAGRFETIVMTHWKFTEMQEAFGLDADSYVYFGGYPGPADLISDEKRWKTYVRDSLIETTISKDIFLISRINKPALLKRLFEFGAIYSGQIVSYNKLLGQLQDAGNTVTLAHYMDLIDQAGLIRGLEKFSKQQIRKRSSSPKFQIYNPAITSCYIHEPFESIHNTPESWGRLVESAMGAHLLNGSLESGYDLYYWRDRNLEVDFILEMNRQLIALEVKTGRNKTHKGLGEFNDMFKHVQSIIVGTGGIPWQEFLSMDPGSLF